MAIDYSNFRMSLQNLAVQHEHLLHLSPEYPPFIHEGMAESVIRRFETCYDTLWKVLRRHLSESLGIVDMPNNPRAVFRIADENHLLAAGGEQWSLYVQTRIDTTHACDGEKAKRAIAVMPAFIGDAVKLYTAMTGEAWE